MSELAYHDFRSFIEEAKKISDYRIIEGADWDAEIGALVESTAELVPQPPMLIFDKVKGYPAGYRVCSLPYAAYRRVALALGLPTDKSKLEILRLAARKVKNAEPIAPKEVSTSPLFENKLTGKRRQPAQISRAAFSRKRRRALFRSGRRLINRDPESGYVNSGTYRMQLHDKNTLGLWISPGQNGRQICAKYWEQGKSCPVVATYGQHPLVFMPSYTKFPYGRSEMEISGGLIGRPLEVLRGPITGLPIPASSEIAIEGEIPPPVEEARAEGPFGEWPGYYSGGTGGTGENQPIIRVKAIYHRDDPILEDEAPLWPGAVKMDLHISAGVLWDQLESAGIQDIVGVYNHTSYLTVVSIKQKYAGHAKQAGTAALSCAAANRNGRYVVVVDDDIDPTNVKEVLWAMMTRVDPPTNIDIIDGCWSTPLDPRMPPEKRENKDHTNGRAIFYAVRPFAWKDKFPKVSRSSRELREKTIAKFKNIIPFPGA